jgi:NAD(P)-dependent dehydrogenase (short-subunit alcohol dehydrogenase family)
VAADLFDVSREIVVVTGAIGQLGHQFARTLVERGARVVVLDVDVAPERRPPMPQDSADRLLYLAADICDRAAVERALAAIEATWGAPTALINNAALDSPPNAPAEENGPFETYPKASWDRIMDVNVGGTFVCCQVFGGRMAQAGRGSIVNISSIYGMVSPDQRLYEYRAKDGVPFVKPVAYSASKSSLMNLTRYLATYWARQGVRVNTLTLAGVFRNQDEQFLAGYTAKMPIGRMAEADEYNGAVLFLCSGASRYMTGSNLVIDGGWTAW